MASGKIVKTSLSLTRQTLRRLKQKARNHRPRVSVSALVENWIEQEFMCPPRGQSRVKGQTK